MYYSIYNIKENEFVDKYTNCVDEFECLELYITDNIRKVDIFNHTQNFKLNIADKFSCKMNDDYESLSETEILKYEKEWVSLVIKERKGILFILELISKNDMLFVKHIDLR